jgi:NAD(P)-dependent dehydrogenase (short-subunit alcohol dehydrogenase family)
MRFNSLIALITGANKGIGLSTAKQLLAMGYHVYLGARDESKGEIVIDQLNAMGFSEVSLLEVDVSDSASVENAVKRFASLENRLDVLVNNAAIGGEQPQQTSSIQMNLLREVLETNYFGAVRVTQAFLPLMFNSDNPRIVNVSSELGSLAFQSQTRSEYYAKNLMAYSTSKVVLNAFTIMLANELHSNAFKINCVSPGFTATDLTGNSGPQTPDEAARIIVKYATLSKDGPSGQFFGIDGQLPW